MKNITNIIINIIIIIITITIIIITITFFVSLRKMALSSTCGQLLHHFRGCDELRDDDEVR